VPALLADIPESHRRDAAIVADRFPGAVDADVPAVDGLVLMGVDETDRLLRRAWAPALAVIGMDDIPRVADAGNVLRPRTTARLSLRVPPSVNVASAAGVLVDLLTTDPPAGARVSVTADSMADGWLAPEPASWVADALERASRRCFDAPPAAYGEGGSIPFLAELGRRFPEAQLVATGVLGPQSNAHGPNEFLHLPMAQAVTSAVGELLAAAATLAAGPGRS
jgi:acetylornithine deacetylase/succinyl-diaminopimelate desuccinylase-like protein